MHMNRKSVYDYFIGLLALMLSLIIVIDIFVSIPQEVRLSFYYIENIIMDIVEVNNIEDIYKAFDLDLNNNFKTVLKWNI